MSRHPVITNDSRSSRVRVAPRRRLCRALQQCFLAGLVRQPGERFAVLGEAVLPAEFVAVERDEPAKYADVLTVSPPQGGVS